MNEATREFVRQHRQEDVRLLALRGTKDPEVDLAMALQQIDGRRRAQEKLPSWAEVEGIVWPPHLSMEQCSSEQTARYKAEVAGRAVCVELQPELCALSSSNFKILGLPQIEVVNGNGVEYLHTMASADLVFIDPARRDEHGGRTYGIADCTPNVLEIIDELLGKAQRVMIKLSPMLDWRKAVEDIGKEHVLAVHIVSVANECKELILKVKGLKGEKVKESKGEKAKETKVVCVNLLPDGSRECFEFDADAPSPIKILHSSLSTLHFLYSPNASVMKAGCFELLAERFGVTPLHHCVRTGGVRLSWPWVYHRTDNLDEQARTEGEPRWPDAG